MIHFSLTRTSSYLLNEGDVFIFRGGSQHVYRVYMITETFVHAMSETERFIRLNRAIVAAPDYVYLAASSSPDRRFNPSLSEASFMLSTG